MSAPKLKVLDLFSGIGGFSLGLERTGGFETVAFCEIEEFPQKVLAKHWPGVPIYDDIRKLDGSEIDANIITGGYPCQPFSNAGKRRGEEDDRHLWPEMFRLIKAIRPRWVVAENVAGHINMGLDSVLSDLEGEGYGWWTFVIPACAVDARHRRDRVWIVANSEGERRRQGRGAGNIPEENGRQDGELPCKLGGPSMSIDDVADSNHQGSQGRRSTLLPEGQEHGATDGHIGQGCRWESEPRVGRVANGVSRRVDRLKGLGNAVVPQIPEILGRAILAAEAA